VLLSIVGALRPRAGRIVLGGATLFDAERGVDAPVEARRIGFLTQRYALFPHLDVLGNVAYGIAAPVAERRRLAREALAELEIDGLAARRPRELSGGEMQRVALARALAAVRGGAGLLILDEPTASLDVRAETELFERFLEVTRGVTSILVSHRLSSVRRADRIVVIDGGRVVEDGPHDALMAAGGRYATMFRLQAERFTAAPAGVGEETGHA